MTKKKSLKIKKDHIEVLLEAIQSDFKAYGDGLDGVDEKVTKGFKEMNQKFDNIDQKFDNIDHEFDVIKAELALIRHDLRQKVDRDEFKLLETRVARLETAIRK